MLDNHPTLAVSKDPHFIVFAIRRAREGLDPPVTPALVDRLLGYRTFARLDLPESVVRAAAAETSVFSEFVSALYTAYGEKHGKPLAGEKTPKYVRYLPLLHSLFPWARTIHLIRDGRDVALSMLDWAHAERGPGRHRLWGEEPVAVCALSWLSHVTAGRRDGVKLGGDHYLEIRYEGLISDTEPTLAQIASFLELPFAREMLEYHRGKTRSEPGLSTKAAWLPPTAGLRDWRAQMPPRDLELYEAIAGNVLSLFGYERAFDTISSDVEERAARLREEWEAGVMEQPDKFATRPDLSTPPPLVEAQ
ncbi:MAG: sulfotransferase [Actinomycetota bacterium]|nr:sulfotransferase [Actinomycetota bacterium]MDQ2980987.1 sulfotransferase [Actinomycetota bacterium]